jgi:tetratricopeptide (TPR) repeat protein
MLLSFVATSMALGDYGDALREARTAQDVMERVVTAHGKASNLPAAMSVTLAESHRWAGDVLRAQGDLSGALAEYRASLEVRERVVADHPEQIEIMGIGHGRLGYLLAEQGDPAGALPEFRAALAIREQLVKQGQGDFVTHRNISIGHRDCGDMLSRLGDTNGALAEYHTALQVANEVAAGDRTNNMDIQWDIAALHDRIGLMLLSRRSFDDAREEYRSALDAMRLVATSDPNNIQKQHDLALFQSRAGDVLLAKGNIADAIARYTASFDVLRALDAKKNTRANIAIIGDLSHRLIMARDFAKALEASDFAISVAPDVTSPSTARAAALMFLGRTDEAREAYLKHRGEKTQNGQTWESAVAADFALFRGVGLADPLMDEIERRFAS